MNETINVINKTKVEFTPLSYQVAYLCKLKESGLINADEFDKINDYLIRKYS